MQKGNSMDFLKMMFETFKCSRCRQQFRRMAIDDKIKTCPRCLNGEESEDE